MFERFKKPDNKLESHGARPGKPKIPDELCAVCPSCKKTLFKSDYEENDFTCHKCGYCFKVPARKRINMIADTGTFSEMFGEVVSGNIIEFPGYGEKLAAARAASGESESVICGSAKITEIPCMIFAMEPAFMMGSMGSAAGERITKTFEYAAANSLPVIGFCLSGGARMQEGIFSLMQMAKTSAAVKRHSGGGGLFISVLTNPTTGGVTASFASLGDIILAEPGALIGFAGPRVIEQTIRQKLPDRFQTAEFVLEKGFVDKIVPRPQQRAVIGGILDLHKKSKAEGEA